MLSALARQFEVIWAARVRCHFNSEKWIGFVLVDYEDGNDSRWTMKAIVASLFRFIFFGISVTHSSIWNRTRFGLEIAFDIGCCDWFLKLLRGRILSLRLRMIFGFDVWLWILKWIHWSGIWDLELNSRFEIRLWISGSHLGTLEIFLVLNLNFDY